MTGTVATSSRPADAPRRGKRGGRRAAARSAAAARRAATAAAAAAEPAAIQTKDVRPVLAPLSVAAHTGQTQRVAEDAGKSTWGLNPRAAPFQAATAFGAVGRPTAGTTGPVASSVDSAREARLSPRGRDALKRQREHTGSFFVTSPHSFLGAKRRC